MNQMTFEIVKVIIMAIFAGITIYLIPYVKKKIGNENLVMMDRWATNAVLYAEQFLSDLKGKDKKSVVMGFLKDVRDKNNIQITDEQLEILVESAVMGMNMGLAGTIVDPYDEEE